MLLSKSLPVRTIIQGCSSVFSSSEFFPWLVQVHQACCSAKVMTSGGPAVYRFMVMKVTASELLAYENKINRHSKKRPILFVYLFFEKFTTSLFCKKNSIKKRY